MVKEGGLQMQELSIFDRAIAAHARWKYRLFQAINTGKSDWTVAQVQSDSDCEFGEWLSSRSPSEANSERCKKIHCLHTQFHAAASEVLAIALAGRKEEAQAAIGLGSSFTAVSAELTMALSDWKDSVTGPSEPGHSDR